MLPKHYITIDLKLGKKLYFASDFHLGAPKGLPSTEREKQIIWWLDSIKQDCQALFLVGDLFDFWFEYAYTIPKGFVRFQAKLAELTDSGIEVYVFPGNHDMWMFGYFESELGIKVFRKPVELICSFKKFYITHGDGLGPGDYTYKGLKHVFENRFFQFVFTLFPSNFCFWIAENWSKNSRISNNKIQETFLGDKEWLWAFAKQIENQSHFDFYVFGHRHLVLDLQVSTNSRYINLGEWFSGTPKYGVFDGTDFEIVKV